MPGWAEQFMSMGLKRIMCHALPRLSEVSWWGSSYRSLTTSGPSTVQIQILEENAEASVTSSQPFFFSKVYPACQFTLVQAVSFKAKASGYQSISKADA